MRDLQHNLRAFSVVDEEGVFFHQFRIAGAGLALASGHIKSVSPRALDGIEYAGLVIQTGAGQISGGGSLDTDAVASLRAVMDRHDPNCIRDIFGTVIFCGDSAQSGISTKRPIRPLEIDGVNWSGEDPTYVDPDFDTSAANTSSDTRYTSLLVASVSAWKMGIGVHVKGNTTGRLAQGILSSDGNNVADGETVTLGAKTYTFRTALTNPAVANEVLRGSDNLDSLLNLKYAINAHPDYIGIKFSLGTAVNTQAHGSLVTNNPSDRLVVTSTNFTYTGGNDTQVSTTAASLSWDDVTLTGGSTNVGHSQHVRSIVVQDWSKYGVDIIRHTNDTEDLLHLDSSSAGKILSVVWADYGTSKWIAGKSAANDWSIYDAASSQQRLYFEVPDGGDSDTWLYAVGAGTVKIGNHVSSTDYQYATQVVVDRATTKALAVDNSGDVFVAYGDGRVTMAEVASSTTPGTDIWALYFKSDGLYYKDDAGAEVGPLGADSGGTVTGSGTSGKLSKWTGASALGDSLISDDGTTVTVSSAAGAFAYLSKFTAADNDTKALAVDASGDKFAVYGNGRV